MTMMTVDNILLVGLGSIGQRHLANLKAMLPDTRIAVLRSRKTTDEVVGCTVFHSLPEAIAFQPDIAFICNPSSDHIRVATELASAGVHLFIEKPLSNQVKGIDQLVKAANKTGIKVMVGYNLRFSTSLNALRDLVSNQKYGRVLYASASVGQYLPDWRPDSDYRMSVSARKELGGGVLLELSHELDYLYWLFGEPVSASGQLLKVSDLDIDVEDLVLACVGFKGKDTRIHASIELDFLQRQAYRTCRIVCENGTLVWDAIEDCVKIHERDNDAIHYQGSKDRNSTYGKELAAFLRCIEEDIPSPIPVEDGLRVSKLIEALKESSDTGKVVYL